MIRSNDMELLQEYVRSGSEEAFATLVSRHINLVYSVALRHVGNLHQAEEISQAVFMILARKAGSFRHDVVVSGWLYHTARLTAANYVRSEVRRAHREQETYMQSLSDAPEADTWAQVAPWLDAAMAELNEKDRNAIVLRFFDSKSFEEVGVSLGTNEDAAKMRVSRAVEKLRKLLGHKGVALSAAVLCGAVSAHSVQAAPIGLAATVSASVLQGATASASTLTLINTTLKIMAWTKAKIAAAISVGVLLVAGTGTVTITRLLFTVKERRVNQLDQSARSLDARPTLLLTADNKKLVMRVRVGWGVVDVGAFAKSFPGDSMTLAQRQLESMVGTAEAEVVGLHNLSDFVNPDGSEVTLDKIEKEIGGAFERKLDKKKNGIKVESLGISSVMQR